MELPCRFNDPQMRPGKGLAYAPYGPWYRLLHDDRLPAVRIGVSLGSLAEPIRLS